MSLLALPVTAAELTTLQAGIQFSTNTDQANQKALFINVMLESRIYLRRRVASG